MILIIMETKKLAKKRLFVSESPVETMNRMSEIKKLAGNEELAPDFPVNPEDMNR